MAPHIATSPSSCFSSDASGNWGCGAWHGHLWFQWKWGTVSIQLPTVVKELLPILLAAISGEGRGSVPAEPIPEINFNALTTS